MTQALYALLKADDFYNEDLADLLLEKFNRGHPKCGPMSSSGLVAK